MARLRCLSLILGTDLKRREVITFLGGVAVGWSLTARAQQGERMRRVGVLVSRAEGDPEGQAQVAAFVQTLQSLGWTTGRNVQIDIRWGAADAASSRRYAAEMVALAPDVILTCFQRSHGGRARSDPHFTNRVCERKRPSKRWLCRESGATWRQRHRVYLCRIRHEREMAGVAQGDCPSRNCE